MDAMKLIKLLPILLGGAGVVQAGLNRTIAQTNGLCVAALINGVVVGLCAVLIFLLVYTLPGLFPDIVAFNREKGQPLAWWYLLPGIIGFCFVFIIPLIIMEVGTLPVFLGVIAGQILVGILWDAHYENIPVSGIRIAGAALTFAGALLVVWKK
jgi:uncharacterized membrane protein YdcZ (DUF606 family)